MADNSNFYQLSGTVTQITNQTYGNFYLEDETGSIFVWGLYEDEYSTDNQVFSSLGISVGDTITICGKYTYYEKNSIDEVVDAYLVSKDSNDSQTGSGSENVGTNGIKVLDFTKATNVKDVTDLYTYLDGCPTTGDVNVLVVPVEFTDVLASSKGYTLDKLESIFNGKAEDTDYYSVTEYFKTSSYGKLNLEFSILDYWYKASNNSNYYLEQVDSEGATFGDQILIDEILAYLESRMDLSIYDSDNNETIDAIVIVPTLDIDSDENGSDLNWAFRYWNAYADSEDYLYSYDGVCAWDYAWIPYSFMFEKIASDGSATYTDTTVMNPYTFIHEFSHVLGSDDYYDTSYKNHPLDGLDMMDAMTGDHNPFSKFNYGWLTSSRLITDATTVELEAFDKAGDTIIIANNWSDSLGVYQEYYVLMYYRNTGLNGGDYGYFYDDGIVMYHINATLTKDGEYYDLANNNTDSSDQYGSKNNLIELVSMSNGDYVHVAKDTSNGNVYDDSNRKIGYTFTVDSLNGDTATITFTKN